MAKLVSKVYGDALLEAAREKGTLDAVYEEVCALSEIFAAHADLIALLNHPQVVKEEKLQIVENVFTGRVSPEMLGFLTTVVDKGRQTEIPAIFRYFIAQVKELKRIGIAHVTTAVELSEAQKAQVEEKLLATTSYKSFEMDYRVDPSLIGGMVIRIGDRVVDSSIKNRLDDLRKQLLEVQLG